MFPPARASRAGGRTRQNRSRHEQAVRRGSHALSDATLRRPAGTPDCGPLRSQALAGREPVRGARPSSPYSSPGEQCTSWRARTRRIRRRLCCIPSTIRPAGDSGRGRVRRAYAGQCTRTMHAHMAMHARCRPPQCDYPASAYTCGRALAASPAERASSDRMHGMRAAGRSRALADFAYGRIGAGKARHPTRPQAGSSTGSPQALACFGEQDALGLGGRRERAAISGGAARPARLAAGR